MPNTTVAAIVYDDNSKNILLTRRRIDPFINYWCLAGGHIDKFEIALDAVIREVKEETGLDFKGTFFGYFDEIIPDYDIHSIVLVYEGTATGEICAQENEVSEIKWFPINEANSLSLAFTHNEILKRWIEQNKKNS